jgi:capsid protein
MVETLQEGGTLMAGKFSIGSLFGRKEAKEEKSELLLISDKAEMAADFVSTPGTGRGNMVPIWNYSYNGEKNLGEIGPPKNYKLDIATLRARAWQSYTDSDITVLLARKLTKWIIGKGLKVQSNPNKIVLNSEGLDITREKFNSLTEARWQVWAASNDSSYSNMISLDQMSEIQFLNSLVGGDILCILRYVDGVVKVQLVDGENIMNPIGIDPYNEVYKTTGNVIRNGVEMDQKGNHVAYHIKKRGLTFETERIEAYGKKTGLKMAWLVYGTRYRDNARGVPFIITVLEKIAKLERYSEAIVGSAEERAKIVYSIEHEIYSSGENPLAAQMTRAFNADAVINGQQLPVDEYSNQLANTIAASTDKQTYNMPLGAKLKALDSKAELIFEDFFMANFDIISAVIDMPPNVALSKYDSSYSASRAAINDFGATMVIRREDTKRQFYQPIYNFWLHTEILKNKIQAPGYLEAFMQKNYMALEAYRTIKVSGPMFPHIDPLKEVTAERLKLGEKFAASPLTTMEAAVEQLNGGDSSSNIEQAGEELKTAEKLGFKAVVKNDPANVKPADKKKD